MMILHVDNDPAACAWTEELGIGDVLCASVTDGLFPPRDRLHLFSGIGGWEIALVSDRVDFEPRRSEA
jgi:hypothetical protein